MLLLDAYMKELQRRKDANESLETFSDRQMLFLVADLWIAGMETTVTTLRWGLLYLLHYPTVQEMVQKEIDDVIKGRNPEMADR